MKFHAVLPFIIILFVISRLPAQEVSLQIQVGGSEGAGDFLGRCIEAGSYNQSVDLPEEIELSGMRITKSTSGFTIGSIYASFTISVPVTTAPGIYQGYIYTDAIKYSGALCFTDTLAVIVEVIPARTPVPDFTTFPQRVVQGAEVCFENLTENPVTEWLWDFGDGENSTAEKPCHVYDTPGTYTVSLTAAGPGGTDAAFKEGYIVVVESGTPGQAVWSFQPEDTKMYSNPAVGSDGAIYAIGSERSTGYLYAINPDGTERWKFKTTYSASTEPVVGRNGTIYAINARKNIFAINPDGTEKWNYQAAIEDDGYFYRRFAAGFDETLYLGTSNGQLMAVDASGNELWNLRLTSGYPGVFSPVIGTDGAIYVLADSTGIGTQVIALNPDGTIKWRSGKIFNFSSTFTSISISRSGNLLLSSSGRITTLNSNGELLWSFPETPNANYSTRNTSVVFDGERTLYIGSETGKVHSFSTDGTKNWEFEINPFRPDPDNRFDREISTLVIGNDGNIYGFSKGGVAFGLSKDGELLWWHHLVPSDFAPDNVTFYGAASMGPNGDLYIIYDDNKLHAISTGSAGILENVWSKEGQNPQNTRSFLCPFPVLTAPLDSAANQSTSLEFSWRRVYLAEEYEIQISTGADFSQNVRSQIVADTALQFINLDYGEYYWRVRPKMAGGETACWSQVRSFSTLAPPPAQTALILPADGATGIPLLVDFQWSPTLRADGYRLQIAKDPAFTDLVRDASGLANTTLTIALPDYESVYYWRVRGANDTGEGPWSQTWSFSTAVAPPAQTSLVLPADDATNIAQVVEFQWSPAPRAVAYRLQVAKDPAFTDLVRDASGLANTTLTIVLPDYETIYYWRVRGANDTGDGPWSQTWSFSTAVAPPSQTALTFPADGATGIPLSVDFQWSPAPGATNYRLQIARDPAFTELVRDASELVNTVLTTTLPNYESTYYWRVRAANGTGEGPWSETWSFTTGLMTDVKDRRADMIVKIYPNPVRGSLFAEWTSPARFGAGVYVFNSLGKIVYRDDEEVIGGENRLEIDLPPLPTGNYVLRIIGGGYGFLGRFVVVR